MAKKFRALSLFLILFLLVPLVIPTRAEELPKMEDVESIVVINTDMNSVVIEKDADKQVFPTGTAKLMTALVAHKHFANNLSQKITVTAEMRDHYVRPWFGFLLNEEVPVDSLLAALLVGNYNDAAVILAYAVSGSIEAFAEEMTAYATSIGAVHTVYKNPTGTHHDEMVTTARDTAIIASHFMENDVLYPLAKKKQHTIPSTNLSEAWTIYSKNALTSTIETEDYYYRFARGMSYGYTAEGGDCVVTSADGTYNGLSYICVVMGGKTTPTGENHAFLTARNVLRYALAYFVKKELKGKGDFVATLPVTLSATVDSVDVVTATAIQALVLEDTDPNEDIRYLTEITCKSLKAPFEEGKKVGTLKAYSKDGKLLAETDLITAESTKAHPFLVFMEATKNMLKSPVFYLVLLLLISGGVAAYLNFTKKGRKKVRKRTRLE